MKESVTSLDVAALAAELERLLQDAILDKAYQPSRDEIVLRFRTRGEGKRDVSIQPTRGTFVTTRERTMPDDPGAFATHLRRHLGGARLRAVRQHALDRVLVLELHTRAGPYEFVLEHFRDGNAILVKDGKVLHPLIHGSWAHRELRPGRDYKFPPLEFDAAAATADQLHARLAASDRDLFRGLAADLGPDLTAEVLHRAGLEPRSRAVDATPQQVAALRDALQGLLHEVRTAPRPVVVLQRAEPVDAAPLPLHRLPPDSTLEPVATFSEALDRLWPPPIPGEPTRPGGRPAVSKAREKLERRAAQIQESLRTFEADEARARNEGDLIYGHYAELEQLLNEARARHGSAGWDAVAEIGRVGAVRLVGTEPAKGTLAVEAPSVGGEPERLELELQDTVPGAATGRYDLAKKMKEKQEGARQALQEALDKLDAMREADAEVVEPATRVEPTRQFWFDTYRWFVASTGHLVVAGRDTTSNERIVKRHMEPADRYVHADLTGAPSVVVKATGGEVAPEALEEAAQFAVAYSRAWRAGHGGGEAYWVTPSQVSKSPRPGEYVGKGAFIIRGDRNYVRAPVLAAVGEVEIEIEGQRARKVMGGPPRAVSARSQRYVVVEPGDEAPEKLGARLARVLNVPVDEVVRALPPGPCRVRETHGVSLEGGPA